MAGVGQTGYWKTGVWVEDLGDPAQFAFTGVATAVFEGTFDIPDNVGFFDLKGIATLDMAWVPALGMGGQVNIPFVPASVAGILGPGDVYVFDGAAGTVILDSQGRLLVVDDAGQVLCIIGPAKVGF